MHWLNGGGNLAIPSKIRRLNNVSAVSGFCVKCSKFSKRYCDGDRNTCMSILFDTIEALQQENEQLHELAKAKADGRLVEVVRCGKCRHYNTTGCSDGCGWCENMDRGVFDEHYCSRGERREKE